MAGSLDWKKTSSLRSITRGHDNRAPWHRQALDRSGLCSAGVLSSALTPKQDRMPHAIVVDAPDPAEYHAAFSPWRLELPEGGIVEAKSAYLRHTGRSVLIEVLAVELGPAQPFFVVMEQKKNQVTVRLFPHPSPQRTPGVHAGVTKVVQDLLQIGGRVERTNLPL